MHKLEIEASWLGPMPSALPTTPRLLVLGFSPGMCLQYFIEIVWEAVGKIRFERISRDIIICIILHITERKSLASG